MKRKSQSVAEFLAEPNCPHTIDGQMGMNANAVYLPKSKPIVNVYLTPEEALRAARNLLQKAEMLMSNNVENSVVQLWISQRKDKTGRLKFGITNAIQKNSREP